MCDQERLFSGMRMRDLYGKYGLFKSGNLKEVYIGRVSLNYKVGGNCPYLLFAVSSLIVPVVNGT